MRNQIAAADRMGVADLDFVLGPDLHKVRGVLARATFFLQTIDAEFDLLKRLQGSDRSQNENCCCPLAAEYSRAFPGTEASRRDFTLPMKSMRMFDGWVLPRSVWRGIGAARPPGMGRAGALCLALAGFLHLPLLPANGQVPFVPTSYPIQSAFGGDTGVYLPPQRMTITVLDGAEGRPVAGAKFSGPFLNDSESPAGGMLTDDQGRATLSFRFPLDASRSLSNVWLWVVHSNHAGRVIKWTAPPERFLGVFPTNYTVRFAATATIGGVVRDTAGQPVAGARLQLSMSPKASQGGDAVRTDESSTYFSPLTTGVITDTKGFWTAAGVPIDLDTIGVLVVRPDGAASSFSSVGTNDPPVDLAALRRTNAVMTLPDGITVRGLIVDEAGQPVAGARLQEWNWRISNRHVFTNGSDGRFELPHRTGSHCQLSVDSPRHVYFITNLVLDPGLPDLRLVLSAARLHQLTMTVLDPEGLPVAGARFSGTFLSGQHMADERPVTDQKGSATLSFRFPVDTSSIPIGSSALNLYVDHSNHVRRTILWTASSGPVADVLPAHYTVRFPAATGVGGFVRDEAGMPVPGARVDLRGDDYRERSAVGVREFTENYWMSGAMTDTNGYWTGFGVPADLGQFSITVRRPDGAVSVFGNSEKTDNLRLDMAALRRTNAVLTLPDTFTVRGLVSDEGGLPVAGVRLQDRGMRGWQFLRVTNGSDGRFELPHRSGTELRFFVEAPGYSGFSTNMTLDPAKPEVHLVLPARLVIRQHRMTVTVLDGAEGRPVAGARFSGSDLSHAEFGGESPVTDDQGVATLSFRILADGTVGSEHYSTTTSRGPSGETVISRRSTVRLSVQQTNHTHRSVTWTALSDKMSSVLPTNYTVRFPALATMGGFVRDEQGRPVAGARLEVFSSSSSSSSSEDNRARTNEVSEYYINMSDRAGVITDTNGFWSVSRVPADLEEFYIVVVRPGGASSSFSSARNAGDGIVDIAALRRANAVLTVPDGVTIRGLVVDEAGQPVPGVRLRERSGRTGRYHLFTNEANGRFELSHRAASQMQISVDSPGHAVLSTNLTLDPPTAEQWLVLSRLRPARLRILDEKGQPVQRAHVQPVEWRNGSIQYEWTGSTDLDGRVTWTNAPNARVIVMVSGMDAPMRRLRLTPGDAEVVVRMDRKPVDSAILRLKVVEAKTGRPVPGATVLRTSGYGREMVEVGKAGPDGGLEVTLRVASPGEHEQPFGLVVRGEGHLEWLSEEQYVLAEGDIELTAALKKGRAAGVVLRPDGQPAIGAKLILNRAESRIYSYRPGDFSTGDSRNLLRTVGADGAFEYPSAAGDDRLLAADRSGFASLNVEDLGDLGRITLQPWVRIEGVVTSAGKPAARQRVVLRSPLNSQHVESYSFQYSTTTDRSGRFVFTNIPPGEHLLVRHVGSPRGSSVDSHRLPVVVKPGETRQVSYELGGRVVTGFVDAEGQIDWTRDAHVLEAMTGRPPPGPEYSGMGTSRDYERVRRAHARSTVMLEFERKRQSFQLVFDRDGAFRIEDVPPGRYELRLRAYEPPSVEVERTGRRGERAEIASLVREIVVPAGAPGTEVDLGTFQVETKGPASSAPKLPPISFRATALDGRPFDLSRVRGRPAIVVFWASWAPRSAARLADLSAAVSGQTAGTNAVLISVNLDDDPSLARPNATRPGAEWTHLRLDGPGRFEVMEQLGIDTLPAELLLDADGSVIARNAGGRRLAAVLNRITSQPQQSSRPRP